MTTAASTASSVRFITVGTQNRCYALCGIATDITDRKRAEEARQQLAKDRLLLLESSGEGFMASTVKVAAHSSIQLQRACWAISRTSSSAKICMSASIIPSRVAPHTPVRPAVFKRRSSAERCKVDDEVYWRKDGTDFPVEYSSFPIIEQEQIIGAVVVFLDTTAQTGRTTAHPLARSTQKTDRAARISSGRGANSDRP